MEARACARVHQHVELFSRHATHLTAYFRDIAAALRATLAGRHTAILDGEIVHLDKQAEPSFDLIQRRLRTPRPGPHLVSSVRAIYFDVLHLDGHDLTSRPYTQRRAVLEDLALSSGPIVVPPVWQDLPGAVLLGAAAELDLEGAVFKRSDSTYHAGRRSRSWIKYARSASARSLQSSAGLAAAQSPSAHYSSVRTTRRETLSTAGRWPQDSVRPTAARCTSCCVNTK